MADPWTSSTPVSVTNLNTKAARGNVFSSTSSSPDGSVDIDSNGHMTLKADVAEVKITKQKKASANNFLTFDADADATFTSEVQFFRNAAGAASNYRVVIHKGTGAYAPGIVLDGAQQRIGINVSSPTNPIEDDSGAKLTDAGVWTDASSVALKENFRPVDTFDVFARLKAMHCTEYNYKADPAGKHIGPIAEEFYEAFGLDDSKTISAKNLAGVLMVAVKGLIDRVEELEKKVYGKAKSTPKFSFKKDYFKSVKTE